MTIIETPTRAQVADEREDILGRLDRRYGTSDRAQLRDASVSGEMSLEDATLVDRLLGLDYLLGEEC
jgi:hypothetical protein